MLIPTPLSEIQYALGMGLRPVVAALYGLGLPGGRRALPSTRAAAVGFKPTPGEGPFANENTQAPGDLVRPINLVNLGTWGEGQRTRLRAACRSQRGISRGVGTVVEKRYLRQVQTRIAPLSACLQAERSQPQVDPYPVRLRAPTAARLRPRPHCHVYFFFTFRLLRFAGSPADSLSLGMRQRDGQRAREAATRKRRGPVEEGLFSYPRCCSTTLYEMEADRTVARVNRANGYHGRMVCICFSSRPSPASICTYGAPISESDLYGSRDTEWCSPRFYTRLIDVSSLPPPPPRPPRNLYRETGAHGYCRNWSHPGAATKTASSRTAVLS